MKKARITILTIIISTIFLNPIIAQKLSFKSKKIKKGEYKEEVSKLKIEITTNLEFSGEVNKEKALKLISSQNTRKNEKILQVKDNEIQKIEVEYEYDEEASITGELKDSKKKPVSGNTYIIKLDDVNPVITYKNGKTPSNDELKILVDEYKNYNKIFSFQELNGKTIHFKSEYKDLEKYIKSVFLDSLISYDIKKISIKLIGNQIYNNEECGNFEIKLKVESTPDKYTTLVSDISGMLLISVDGCYPILLELKGPITSKTIIKEDKNKLVMDGNGNMEIIINNTYKK